MLSERLMSVAFLLLGFSLAGGFLIHLVLGAVRRLRELPPMPGTIGTDERLRRIEVALQDLRLDMDRLVELQRLAARPDLTRLAEPREGPRVNTPH